MERILTVWPALRAIYIIRDPRGVFDTQSHARQSVGWTLLPEEFVVYWRDSVLAWQRFAARNPNSLLIRYADLVQDTRGVMTRVCDFLAIQWDNGLLKPTRGGVPWSGNSRDGATFNGISTNPLERYRQSLTPGEIQTLEVWLGDLMAQHGWHSAYKNPSVAAQARDLLLGGSHNLKAKLKMMRAIWRTRQRQRRESTV